MLRHLVLVQVFLQPVRGRHAASGRTRSADRPGICADTCRLARLPWYGVWAAHACSFAGSWQSYGDQLRYHHSKEREDSTGKFLMADPPVHVQMQVAVNFGILCTRRCQRGTFQQLRTLNYLHIPSSRTKQS